MNSTFRIASIVLLVSFSFHSCKQLHGTADHQPQPLPSCITAAINQNPEIKAVRSQIFGDVRHYWLETGATQADLAEHVMDENCNIICTLCGECIQPECAMIYGTNWVLEWQR